MHSVHAICTICTCWCGHWPYRHPKRQQCNREVKRCSCTWPPARLLEPGSSQTRVVCPSQMVSTVPLRTSVGPSRAFTILSRAPSCKQGQRVQSSATRGRTFCKSGVSTQTSHCNGILHCTPLTALSEPWLSCHAKRRQAFLCSFKGHTEPPLQCQCRAGLPGVGTRSCWGSGWREGSPWPGPGSSWRCTAHPHLWQAASLSSSVPSSPAQSQALLQCLHYRMPSRLLVSVWGLSTAILLPCSAL